MPRHRRALRLRRRFRAFGPDCPRERADCGKSNQVIFGPNLDWSAQPAIKCEHISSGRQQGSSSATTFSYGHCQRSARCSVLYNGAGSKGSNARITSHEISAFADQSLGPGDGAYPVDFPPYGSIPRISGTAIPPRLHVCQVRCVIRGTKLVSWGHLDTPWSKPHKFATGSTRPTCRLRRRHGGCTCLRSASMSFCHVCSPAASRQQIPIRACTTWRPSILGAEPAIAHHH